MARRSDIAKLVSKAREVWRQSENYQAAKKACRITEEGEHKGWFRCAECGKPHEVIKIDHKEPIGKQPTTMEEFGPWLPRLFCPVTNLQGLGNDCHKVKTKAENAARQKAAKERKK